MEVGSHGAGAERGALCPGFSRAAATTAVCARKLTAWAPPRRQPLRLLLLSVLSLPKLGLVARVPDETAKFTDWDEYFILRSLDHDHGLARVAHWFHGDWIEENGYYRPLTASTLKIRLLLCAANAVPSAYNLGFWITTGASPSVFLVPQGLRLLAGALLIALVVWLNARTVPRVLLFFVVWEACCWIPLLPVHLQGKGYHYVPDLARHVNWGAAAFSCLERCGGHCPRGAVPRGDGRRTSNIQD